MRVLAVDPGLATGMALFEGDNVYEDFSCWIEKDRWAAVDRARVEMTIVGIDVLVIENYRISGARAKDANLTIELIGALKWIAHKRNVPVVMQEPGAGQKFVGKRWEKL